MSFRSADAMFVARVTIELRTPMVVRANRGGDFQTMEFVADANDLPVIPGSSICGALRNAAENRNHLDPHILNAIFGHGLEGGTNQGQGSRLWVSWAHMHDRGNRPVEGLCTRVESDPVLRVARLGGHRDHVRHSDRGTAERRGKFAERVVARGHRFTFELRLEGWSTEQADWEHLLSVLCSADMRLGAGARRGYGAFRVIALRQRRFDMRKPADAEAFEHHPVELRADTELHQDDIPAPSATTSEIRLTDFRAQNLWLFGKGGGGDDADYAALREPVIAWPGERQGEPRLAWVLPASGIKGVFAHRLAFHANRLHKCFSMRRGSTPVGDSAVRAVFGEAKQTRKQQGRPGLLLFDDVHVLDEAGIPRELAPHVVYHNRIDRFTHGNVGGFLYSEEALPRDGSLDYVIRVPDSSSLNALDPKIKAALVLALEDVRRGHVTFGGRAARGHGAFECEKLCWSPDLSLPQPAEARTCRLSAMTSAD